MAQINNATARNPAYIQLHSLECLEINLQGSGEQNILSGWFDSEPVAGSRFAILDF